MYYINVYIFEAWERKTDRNPHDPHASNLKIIITEIIIKTKKRVLETYKKQARMAVATASTVGMRLLRGCWPVDTHHSCPQDACR